MEDIETLKTPNKGTKEKVGCRTYVRPSPRGKEIYVPNLIHFRFTTSAVGQQISRQFTTPAIFLHCKPTCKGMDHKLPPLSPHKVKIQQIASEHCKRSPRQEFPHSTLLVSPNVCSKSLTSTGGSWGPTGRKRSGPETERQSDRQSATEAEERTADFGSLGAERAALTRILRHWGESHHTYEYQTVLCTPGGS